MAADGGCEMDVVYRINEWSADSVLSNRRLGINMRVSI